MLPCYTRAGLIEDSILSDTESHILTNVWIHKSVL